MRNFMIFATFSACVAGVVRADPPNVVADIAPVHSLVAQVMDGVGSPELILPPGASPHGYALRPSQARALQNADLVLWVGPGLTPWLEDATSTLAGSETSVIALSTVDGVEELPFREIAVFGAGKSGDDHHDGHGHDDHDDGHEDHDEDHAGHDHDDHKDDDHDSEHSDHDEEHGDAHAKHDGDEHGHDDHGHDDHGEEHAGHDDKHDDHDENHAGHDDHGDDHAEHDDKHDDHDDHAGHDHHGHDHGDLTVDPHMWLDPHNAEAWVTVIADELSRIDPENAAAYDANAKKALERLEALEADVKAELTGTEGNAYVVYHDAYRYFESHFGVRVIGSVAASDASSPSAGRIAELTQALQQENVACIFTEPQFSPGLVTALQEGGVFGTAILDPVGSSIEPGPDFYDALMMDLAGNIARCG